MFKYEQKGVAAQRLSFLVITLIMYGIIWWISPQKGFDVFYIMVKLGFGASIGYWIHMMILRNFRPAELRQTILGSSTNLNSTQPDPSVMLANATINTAIWSRTIIVAICILGFAVAL